MSKPRISQYLFATLLSVILITSHSAPILAEEEILSGDESVIDSIEEISDEICSDCDEIFMPYAGEGIFADATQIGNVGDRYFNYEASKAVKINLNTAYYTICYKENNGYNSDGFYAFYRFDALMEGKYTISILAPGTFDLSLHKGTVDSTNPMGRLYKNDSIAQKTIVTGLQAGDYLVRVDTTGKSTNYSNPDKIFLRVDYTPANLDSSDDWIELEMNDKSPDNFSAAMPYKFGKKLTGSRYIGEWDNTRNDLYTFTTTESGFITFSELSNIASNIQIYNSARDSIAYIKPTGNYSKSVGLAAGKYYFDLVGKEDTTNYDATKYTFKIDFTEYNNVETEENGRLTRSNTNMNNDIYQTIDVNKTYWGSFYGEEDGDLYKVNIPETMDSLTVNFSTDMTGAKIYIDGGIYNLSGKSYTIDDRKITAGEHKIGFFIGESVKVSASNKTYTFNIGGEASEGPGGEGGKPSSGENPSSTPIYKPEKSEAYTVDSIINYDVYLVKGGSTTIDAVAKSKSDGKDYKLTLDSNAKKIVSVSNKGVIKGKSDGTATVLLEKAGIKYKLNVTVATPTFTNPKKQYEVNAGEKINLELKNINTAPQFSSKKASVATVDKVTGEVKGLKAGTTNIIVMVNGKKFTCNVKVYDPVIKGKPLIKVGKKQKLSIKNGPKASSFLSSNTKVATIDSAGQLNAISSGKTTITAISNGKTVTFEVTVTE